MHQSLIYLKFLKSTRFGRYSTHNLPNLSSSSGFFPNGVHFQPPESTRWRALLRKVVKFLILSSYVSHTAYFGIIWTCHFQSTASFFPNVDDQWAVASGDFNLTVRPLVCCSLYHIPGRLPWQIMKKHIWTRSIIMEISPGFDTKAFWLNCPRSDPLTLRESSSFIRQSIFALLMRFFPTHFP